MDKLKKKCDYILYNEGRVNTLEKALKFDLKVKSNKKFWIKKLTLLNNQVLSPFWIVDSIREKKIKPLEKYLIEVRVSDLLLRKRKYNNIRQESQDSIESQKEIKKIKKEKSNIQRKSKN